MFSPVNIPELSYVEQNANHFLQSAKPWMDWPSAAPLPCVRWLLQVPTSLQALPCLPLLFLYPQRFCLVPTLTWWVLAHPSPQSSDTHSLTVQSV